MQFASLGSGSRGNSVFVECGGTRFLVDAGFSGAEIEQAVVSAIYGSRSRERPTDTSAVLDALGATRPLSVVMAENMQALRAWAAERTVRIFRIVCSGVPSLETSICTSPPTA